MKPRVTWPPTRHDLTLRPITAALAVAVAVILGFHGAARAAAPAEAGVALHVAGSAEDRIDLTVRRGRDQPAAARAALHELAALLPSPTPQLQRTLLTAEGLIAASQGDEAGVGAAVDRLRARASTDGLADAAAATVLAALSEHRAQPLDVQRHVQAAQAALADRCGDLDPEPGEPAVDTATPRRGESPDPLPEACDYRLAWRLLSLTLSSLDATAPAATALSHAQTQWRLARRAQDPWRSAASLSTLALARAAAGELDAGLRLMRQAQQQATALGDPELLVRLAQGEQQLAMRRGDAAAARDAAERGVALARRAGLERLEATELVNLADVLLRDRQPAAALDAAERALALARPHGERRVEQAAQHNVGLAQIAIGRVAEGRQTLDSLLAQWRRSGALADEIQALREFGEALAPREPRLALELYHRERERTAELRERHRDAALRAVQARYDVQRQQRDIELLSRDNALKAAELDTRGWLQWLWGLGAAAIALSGAIAVLLVLRARQMRLALELSHAQLRVQSERDALTQLANRRHFQQVVQTLGLQPAFRGALLMVDLDHFKRVNDRHGHAVGDGVLIEVARRLQEVVRQGDLVVRWGGEEFLVLAPDLPEGQLEAMARRILQAMVQSPIPARDDLRLTVTASIGYARFPLPPHAVNVPWDQAIDLVDMALYVAKTQGRHRAIGIESAAADGPQAMTRIAADFERAWHDGDVRLAITVGPPQERPEGAP